MNLNTNYYLILGVKNDATEKEIKKAYYKLSFEYHPDINKNVDHIKFSSISEAYDVLMDKTQRSEYDKKSKYGNNYDESSELLNYEFNNNSKTWDKGAYDDFKKNEVLNIIIHIDESFDGSIEYDRWVLCKKCNGSGKDTESKIEIKDKNGNILKIFDGEDGCDFCEGTGKDYNNNLCNFCGGEGKIGSSDCKNCNGNRRILGRQKLTGIVFKEGKEHKIESMGHSSKDISGKSGHLWLVRKN